MLIWPRKTPDEILDYSIDWADQLSEGESIATSVWELLDSTGEAPELQITNETLNPTASIVWLTGGEPKRKYHLTNTITTTGTRTMQQSVWLRVAELD